MSPLPSTSNAFLLCRSGSRLYALPIEHVIETMRPLSTTGLADMPAFMLGLSIIRGATTPVVHVAHLLGEPLNTPITRFVTIKLGPRVVAFAVGEVIGVRLLATELMTEIPLLLQSVDSQQIAAISILDAELLVILQSTRVVPHAVWSMLDQSGQQP